MLSGTRFLLPLHHPARQDGKVVAYSAVCAWKVRAYGRHSGEVMMRTTVIYNFVIPVQAEIQLIKNFPQRGTRPKGMLDKTAGFRPAPE